MRILISGRSDRPTFERAISLYEPETTAILCACDPMLEVIARSWAKRRGVAVRGFTPDFKADGPRAHRVRNRKALVEGQPDVVLAFSDGGELETAHMMMIARDLRVRVVEVKSGAAGASDSAKHGGDVPEGPSAA